MSRTLSKLETVAKEIRKTFNVQTAVIDVDFTSGPEIYDTIKDHIVEKEIGILVNNVGMSYFAPDFLLSIANREQLFQDLIECNITSVPMMCSIIMPQMVQRKRGLIINISSLSASVPAPTITVYSASKAFVDKFSKDLAAEYQKDGIIVQSVLPGFVVSNMTKLKKDSLIAPMPDKFVESALSQVGFTNYTTGYIVHSIMQFGSQLGKFIAPSLIKSLTVKLFIGRRDHLIRKGLYKTS